MSAGVHTVRRMSSSKGAPTPLHRPRHLVWLTIADVLADLGIDRGTLRRVKSAGDNRSWGRMARVWPDPEHNILAHALNGGLWDLGLPSLAPRREPEAAARDAAPDTGRPSP